MLILLAAWEASVRFDIVRGINWPAFSDVVVALCRNLLAGELPSVIGATLWVMLRGYVIGCAAGIVLGFAIALLRPVRLTIEPSIDVLRTIPIMAGLRTALRLALIVTVVSEMIAGSGGVGYYLLQIQYALQPANMYAAIILLAAVAYLLNQIFVMWEARIIHRARTREASWTA